MRPLAVSNRKSDRNSGRRQPLEPTRGSALNSLLTPIDPQRRHRRRKFVKMRRLAICAACSVTTFAASVSADTYPRQAGIDAVHLVVDHEQVIIEAWHEHG